MYIFQNWGDQFTASLQDTWQGFASFVPNFIIAVILFIVGWVVASVIGKAVAQVIGALKIDKALESAGADDVMDRAGLKLNVGGFIGGVVKWFIIVVFLITSLNLLGLSDVSGFLRSNILDYLPQVLKAALVLIIATVLSDFMGKVVTAGSRASGVRSANFLGTLTRYSIWIFALIIALGTLGIAAAYMQIIFTGLVAMLAIGGGLAFGLGGKEAAARAISHLHDRVKPLQ
jgi:hypothetical protein